MSDKRGFLDRLLEELTRLMNDNRFSSDETAISALSTVHDWALEQTLPPIMEAEKMGTKAEQLEKVTVTFDIMKATERSLHENAKDLGLTDGEVLDHMLLKYDCKDPALAAMRIWHEIFLVTFNQDENSFLSTVTFIAKPLLDMLRNPKTISAYLTMKNCSEDLSSLGELIEQVTAQIFLKKILIENPDKIILNFTDETITFSDGGHERSEYYPGLEKRTDHVLELLGYSRHNTPDLIDAVDAFADEKITIDELKQRLMKLSGK